MSPDFPVYIFICVSQDSPVNSHIRKSPGVFIARRSFGTPEPIVLVIFNIKSARYLVLFAGKSTR
jgi:hypothetical protein